VSCRACAGVSLSVRSGAIVFHGSASGLFRTSIYIGSIASATITSLVFRTQVSDHGLHQIAVILTAVSVVILLMTLADRRIHARPHDTTNGQSDAATAKKSPVPGSP
jgi:hypothetical protein